MIAALDVKGFVLGTAVENVLVAPDVPANGVKGLDHLQAQFLALVFFCNGDFLYMADEPTVVDTTAKTMARVSAEGGRGMGGEVDSMSCRSLPKYFLFLNAIRTYNFLSTISEPVPTTQPWASMTRR